MKNTFKEISTKELLNQINHTETKIIDVRPVDAYNGWQLRNEKRGGHIKGAKSLPAKWAKYLEWIEIVRSKRILPEHKLIIYGYDSENIEQVANLFDRAGYKDINIYLHFIDEWSADDDLPMEQLKRYHQLVSSDWLHTLISGEKPSHYYGKNYVICHAHYRNRGDYDKGHIPGAVNLDTLWLESSETWNRHTPDIIKKTLLKLGISCDTTVILYGRFSFPKKEDPFPGSSAGQLGAMRCGAIMMYAGVKDVKVLNGGLQSWEDDGYTTVTEETKPIPADDFGLDIPAHPEIMIDTPKAKELLKSPTGDLVCVRSWSEYIGEVSGYNYIDKRGRIPGAVFGNCGSDAYHMENYRNLDHTTREYHEIEKLWEEVNITPDKHLAFYCGTGWRGSEAFFNAWLMGYPKVSVYDGGWFEWSNDPKNPTETGIPL
ncbi:MAG: sulfurtransferase [Ignavibacteria bacterium]|nr:sulfurtransferase [Ignavibacteria bacterium]